MPRGSCSFRSVVVLLLSGSLILTPAASLYARGDSDDLEITIPAPPGFPGKARVTVPTPHGVPVPVPVPVPGVPAFVEKHREWQPPPVARGRGPNWHDNREYSRNRPNPRHDYDRDWRPRPHGGIHRNLPLEAFALSVAGAAFFFHMGNYYRHTDEGYVVVQAPIGARIRNLPERCSPLDIEGHRYFVCDDVYYEIDGDEYVVIEPPSRGDYRVEPPSGDYRVEIGERVRIKVDSLNVRSGPGKRYDIIGKLYRDDVVEVGGMEGEWYYVAPIDGAYGWILQEHVLPEEADMR